ncbi:MAG: leucyl aminopeptidase [Alphaproteobacteria bacterium]
MNFTFTTTPDKFSYPLIIPVFEQEDLDKKFQKQAELIKASCFTAKKGEVISYLTQGHLVYLLGVGKKTEKDIQVSLQQIGGKIAGFVSTLKNQQIAISCSSLEQNLNVNFSVAAYVAYGLGLGTYSFDTYKTKKENEQRPEEVLFFSNDENKDNATFETLFAVMDGIYEARDLISEPANMLSPQDFVDAVRQMKMENVKITVLDKAKMEKLGMNLILNVGAGAKKPPFLLVMEYMNGKKDDNPVVLVGKGVCFDSGGMNLKPSQGLTDMKYDMAGGAAVVGTLWALSNIGIKKNVVGIVPLVENMLSSTAQHTQDVWRAMSGKTVEVGNTDAEGRLILADALWYGQENYNPKAIIDIATLTGAMRYVFGSQYAALYSNDDKLAEKLKKASDTTLDKIWQLPLNEAYADMLKSPIADICNIGGNGEAGSSSAAMFIKSFIKDNTPWAHLDIASVAWTKKRIPCAPEGPTGFGVALLTQMILED